MPASAGMTINTTEDGCATSKGHGMPCPYDSGCRVKPGMANMGTYGGDKKFKEKRFKSNNAEIPPRRPLRGLRSG